MHGVAVKSVPWLLKSNRVMLMKLKANPVDINIIQLYTPTAERAEGDFNKLYSTVNEAINNVNYLTRSVQPFSSGGQCSSVASGPQNH